ncbi:tail fiber domain-containing protein [Bacillus sp. FSL L8-0099]|uniref:tail fiber domain-containing protein n=1 Tax=unclassified Bacillus (in: firmicutes) TaxID=185979 RepID=UPI0030FB0FA1
MPRYIRYKENDEWKYASVKDVGDLSELKTLAKTDVVTAINSLIDGGMADVVNEQIKQAELIKTAQDLINTLNSEVEAISTVGNELKGKVADMESEINSKVNVEDYEKEYKDVTSKLRDKADLTEFQKVGKDVDTLTVSVENINGALEQKVNRTTYEHDLGLNKWVASKYEVTGTDFDNTAPSFALIKGLSAKEVNEFPDASSMVAFTGDNIITHYFTNVNLKDRKTVYFNVTHEDSLTIYMNGAKIYENGHMSTVGTKVALGFNAGWNTVDILHGNRTGAPVMNLGVKLSTQVDKFTAVIGVGDKNDARLREAETSLKQTEESIKIMATKNEVTELGNKVESQSASMEVLSNAIKSKVETERFNEYSDRLETTESSVEIIEGKIVNLVEKKDFDELNGKYSTQQTKIEQMDKSIGLKASNEKVDKLSGRVEVAEGAIEVANDEISLTVTGLDNLGKKTTAIEQDTGKIKQSVTDLSKSVTAQGIAIEEHSTSITSLNESIALKAEADKVYTIEQANGKIAESTTKLKSEIEVTTKGISQTVTDVKKEVDGMKTTVESQGTQIKQTAEEVAVNVVKKGNVKTSINASEEGVKILGKHLDITGAVTFQSLDPSMQSKVNAGADAKNQIDGMQFGAKNIIRKKQITPINVASSSYDEATNTWTLTANSGAGGSWGAGVRITDKTSVVPIGSWFTISFEIYSPIDANWNADVNNFPVTGTSTTNDNDDIAMRKTSSKSLKANTWTKCWFSWKNKDNSTTDLYDQSNIGLVNNSGAPVTFKIRNVKGELGNVVTDFTLAQEDIDEMINNISFGGRNIFLNAGLLQGATNWYSNVAQTAVVDDGEDKAFKFTPNSGAGRAGIYQRLGGGVSATRVFEKDQEYTVSVMMKASTGSHKLHIGAESIDVKTVDVDTTWREYSHTFKGTGAGNGTVIFYTTAVVSGVDFFIKRMQLEKGNRKTDFTLAPEDYDKLLSEVNKKAQDSQNAIDNMSIGGNNLLLNSHADYSTTEYQIATYTLTENWVAGQEYTFVIKGTVPAGQKFGIWMNGGSSNVGYATTKYSEGVTYVTFKAVTPAGGHTKSLGLYNYPSNTTTSTVDWVALYKGNKPMDWTISSGDIQNLFTGVDEKATASKNAIADMSNDNKATPIEKQQLKKEWATITAEKPNYEALANTYGVTTEKTNYINAYNALNTAISPIISNASITSDINGATFRNTFDDYYDKQSQLIKKINELARSIGTSAESKAQSAQNSIADMSSDSKITPVEKVQLKKEWAVMASEKPQYEVLATTYGIGAEKTNFVNAYNTLNTVLNGTGGILTNMTTTSAVTGATFRGQFDDYYDKKSQLVKVINEKAKSLADSAQGTANGVNNTIKPWIFPNKTTINGAQIETGSVKAVQIDVNNLFANTAFINNLKTYKFSADQITGGTIKGIRYESINASNSSIKLVLEGNSLKSYGAMDTTAKKQNYAEMKDGGISVFEMAESGSPFGDRKAYVEPARFNAQQGSSYSVALEPTELRFWVPNMTGTISYDVTGNTATGYGLRLEANGGILVKNKVDINHPAIQFENRESIFIDGWGNFQGGKYSTQYATWSMKDADGRIRMLIPMGKGTQAGNEYHSHAGGHKFFYNGSLGLSTYVQGGDSPIIQFNGRSILKYWGGGNYFEFKNQWDSGFVPVYASAFNTASSLIWKTDIESYEKSALDVVMGTNIVTYKYKSDVEESDNPQTHVGVIAEYAPKEIQSKDGRGVDNYAMSSLAWKAIQELSEQVRYLKEKLNNR